MVQLDPARRELRLKIVYAGPGLSGKTTNLRHLHETLPPDRRGRLVSLAAQNDRTLFFDFMPVDIENVAGYRLQIAVYTVPGQSAFRVSQLLILRDVDGVVFVADSHPERAGENRQSLDELHGTLSKLGVVPEEVPIVMQYNKRDLKSRMALEELESVLNPGARLFVPAIATEGKGVVPTLREVTRLAVKRALHATDGPEDAERAAQHPGTAV